MVIKGGARGGAMDLAKHLQRTDTNEKMELRELRGVCSDTLTDALREMEAVASGARSKRHFYHASINTRADEPLTPEQERRAIDRLEAELGLTGQARAVVAHVKEGRAHLHIVWSRIDLETMRAIPDSHNYRRHELVARELEREFGHERVQGAHIEREGVERPERTPSHAEMQQAERTGLTPQDATALITGLWQQTDSGQAFAAAVADRGWILARGDRRDFVVVDSHGEPHSLARRIEGARAKDVRERLADLDPAALPSVEDARAQQVARSDQARQQGGAGKGASLDLEHAPVVIGLDQAKAVEPAAIRVEVPELKPHGEREVPTARTETPPRSEPAASTATADAASAVGKATDGLMNAVGGLVDFFVDGPKPPPSPAELEQRAEAAAAATRREAADSAAAEQKRQSETATAQAGLAATDWMAIALAQLRDGDPARLARDEAEERERRRGERSR